MHVFPSFKIQKNPYPEITGFVKDYKNVSIKSKNTFQKCLSTIFQFLSKRFLIKNKMLKVFINPALSVNYIKRYEFFIATDSNLVATYDYVSVLLRRKYSCL